MTLLEGRLAHRVESPSISLKQDKLWKFNIRFSGAKFWDSVDCTEIKTKHLRGEAVNSIGVMSLTR